jgi:hypothetical protein
MVGVRDIATVGFCLGFCEKYRLNLKQADILSYGAHMCTHPALKIKSKQIKASPPIPKTPALAIHSPQNQ